MGGPGQRVTTSLSRWSLDAELGPKSARSRPELTARSRLKVPEDSKGFSGQDVTQNTPEQAGRQLRFLPERTRTGSLWKPNVLALLDTRPHTRGLQRKRDPRDDTCYVEERHSGPQRQPLQHPGTPARARAPRDQLSTQPRTREGRSSSGPAGRARGLATRTAQRPLEDFSDMAQRELRAAHLLTNHHVPRKHNPHIQQWLLRGRWGPGGHLQALYGAGWESACALLPVCPEQP